MDESGRTPGRAKGTREGEGGHEAPSPKRAAEQRSPEQERPPTPDEEAGQSIEELDQPPQAEGPRETVERSGRSD